MVSKAEFVKAEHATTSCAMWKLVGQASECCRTDFGPSFCLRGFSSQFHVDRAREDSKYERAGRRVWPQNLVFFEQLEPVMKDVLGGTMYQDFSEHSGTIRPLSASQRYTGQERSRRRKDRYW